MQATGFLPSRDGFSFRNDFDYPASRLGRGAPLASGFGLAGGMCLAALDRWSAGRPLPVLPGSPKPGEILYEELLRRQVELLSHGGWDRILEWQGRPGLGRLFGTRGVGELTRSEWGGLRRSLDRGMPALLCVLRTRGPFANPSENPIVLAYRYEYARDAKRGTIWVYDPNRPGNDDVRLTIVPGGRGRSPEVTFVAERVRGFLQLDYDRSVAAPLRPIELAVADEGGFTGRAAALPGRDAHAVVRGRDGGLVVVRHGKGTDAEPRLQRHGAETVLASDPAVVPGTLPTVVARDTEGNVLGLRIGVRGWRPRLLPSPKAPLQLDFGPVVALNRGRVHVFGVQKGRLAHLQRSRAGKWSAGIVPGQANPGAVDPLEGTPSPCVGADRLVRVFTRTSKGRIAMASLSKEGQWTTTLLPLTDAPIAGDPIALVAPGDSSISVLAVTEDGELIHLRGGGADKWRIRNLTRETGHDGGSKTIRVEIAVTGGPGNTLHVFGVSPARGLIHYWCPPTLAWRAQDLTDGRAEVGDAARVRGRPSVVATSDGQLVVAAAAEKGVVVYRWSAAADWTGDALPLPPSLAQRTTVDGPVLWRDARGKAHLLAVLDDGRAILGVPGRPESTYRAIATQPAPAVQPPRRETPLPGSEQAAAATVVAEEAAALAVADVALEPDFERDSMLEVPDARASSFASAPEEAVEPAEPLDLPTAPASLGELSLDGLGSLDLPENDVNVHSLGVMPMAGDTSSLLDFGDMGGVDEADDAVEGTAESLGDDSADDAKDREGWGSYATSAPDEGTVDLGTLGFQPAAPLMADPDSAPRRARADIPSDLTLPGTTPRRADASVQEADRARVKAERNAAKEAERKRIEAERVAAEEERQRLAAEKAERARVAAEDAERARLEAERIAAEEAARIAAEEAELARLAAEEAERLRIEAERIAAEEAERARIEAERAAAEEAERQRIEAERIAAEEAERQRIEAERIAAEEAERQRIEAERVAADEAERQRIEAERVAAEEAERQRIEAERVAAEEAERQRIEAERVAAEEAERQRIEAERIAAEEAERERIEAERIAAEKTAAEKAERVAAEKEAARLAAEKEANRRERERAAKKADAERAARAKEQARAKEKNAKGGKRQAPAPVAKARAESKPETKPSSRPETVRPRRTVPAALEGLPLLDDTIKPREPRPAESAKPEETRPKEHARPKPKLRSVDDLIRLSDEHEPTFDKK